MSQLYQLRRPKLQMRSVCQSAASKTRPQKRIKPRLFWQALLVFVLSLLLLLVKLILFKPAPSVQALTLLAIEANRKPTGVSSAPIPPRDPFSTLPPADVGEEVVLVGTEPMDTRSVAWGDWDGDGDLDLAIGNYGEVNQVYENDGGGLKLNGGLGWVSPDEMNTTSLAWGDWDGDGDLDLVVGNEGQVNQVFESISLVL